LLSSIHPTSNILVRSTVEISLDDSIDKIGFHSLLLNFSRSHSQQCSQNLLRFFNNSFNMTFSSSSDKNTDILSTSSLKKILAGPEQTVLTNF
jgi:hypothetical protein